MICILARVASASLTPPSLLIGLYLSDQGAQSFLSIHSDSLIKSSSLTLSIPSVHKLVPARSCPSFCFLPQSHHCYLHLNISEFDVTQTGSQMTPKPIPSSFLAISINDNAILPFHQAKAKQTIQKSAFTCDSSL